MSSYDIVLIGGRYKSHTPPFTLNFEVLNKNFHNHLVDSGASSIHRRNQLSHHETLIKPKSMSSD